MFIEKKIECAMQRLLQKPGSEGLTASDIVAQAIEIAYMNGVERLMGRAVPTEGLNAFEAVIELATGAAMTSEDWWAIRHVAEMVGLEDTADDISISVVG